jgi:hypothetical protein
MPMLNQSVNQAEDADDPGMREALLQLISTADLDHDYGA